jgi:serine/threonine protein kinase
MAGAVVEINKDKGVYEVSFDGQVAEWKVTPRYSLTEWLGGGAYGHVCRAIDRDNANGTVAIKRISNIFKDYETALRILREVSILRRLDHPNIIKIVDVIQPERSVSQRHGPFKVPKQNLKPNFFNVPLKVLYIVFEDGGIDLKKWMLLFADPLLHRPSGAVVRSLLKQMVANTMSSMPYSIQNNPNPTKNLVRLQSF